MIHRAYAFSFTTEAFNPERAKLRSILSRLDYLSNEFYWLWYQPFSFSKFFSEQSRKKQSWYLFSTVRISLPFKDSLAASAVRKQLCDLSHNVGPTLQPVFVSSKSGQDLKPKETEHSVVNKQSVVYTVICAMKIMSGKQPDASINALLSTEIRESEDIS